MSDQNVACSRTRPPPPFPLNVLGDVFDLDQVHCSFDKLLYCNVLKKAGKSQREFHDQEDGALHQDLARAMVINAFPPDAHDRFRLFT